MTRIEIMLYENSNNPTGTVWPRFCSEVRDRSKTKSTKHWSGIRCFAIE